MAAVAAQQQAALYRATNGGRNNGGNVGAISFRNYSGNMGCAGGYPYCGAKDSSSDQWGLLNRECVSYAAWAAYNRFGKDVQNFAGAGNAYQWPSTTVRMGAVTNGIPEVGSVAVAPPSAFAPVYGHVMVVEDVLGGGWVRVSQYNFGGTGEYSTMEISVSGLSFVHFRNR
jgi:surface antigen